MKSKKNKGFTLIEMVVAFAVLSIAVFGIGGFFVSAARSYSSVSDETSLQYEAQLALNQVENMLIDSTLGVSYNYVDEAGSYQFVKKDGDATGTAASKVLYAYNINEADPAKLDIMMLKWVKATNAIYYRVEQITGSVTSINSINIAEGDWDLLAEDVTSFAVDLSEYEKTKKVKLHLDFENRSKDYETTGTVVLRNDVLINEMDVQKIYERVTKIVKSTITGVALRANTDVSVPGGAVQLYTKVQGTGYPNQDIHQWIVATDRTLTNIIYDSTANVSLPKTYINTGDKVLHISDDTATVEGSTFNEILWIQAIVNVKDAEDNIVPVKSEPLSINVKFISDIVVKATADLTRPENQTLSGNTVFSEAQWSKQKGDSKVIPTMVLHPRNVVEMTATVTSSDSINGDVSWSIIGKSNDVIAEIDNTGLLKINQYSKTGSFFVRATLKADSAVYVDYQVNVGTEYTSSNAKLEIETSEATINRGGNLDCSLKLNDVAVDNGDYDWSLKVISSNGQEITTGEPVTVNQQGGVYANYDLSYDYSYTVLIKAALKTNPDIFATKIISVPKVSLSITPTQQYGVKMGDTVSGITCKAVGLESYDIGWEMAKESNPKYFFTAWGNFNITGSKNSNGEGTAKVVMGKASSDPQTNVIVKAYLKDHTNYQATMKILTGNVELKIEGGSSISRPFDANDNTIESSEIPMSVKLENATSIDIDITNERVSWGIIEAKVGQQDVLPEVRDELEHGRISIGNGKLIIYDNFAENYKTKDMVLTIRAYIETYNLEATHTVTVNPFTFEIKPDKILIPDGSAAQTITYSPSGLKGWSLSGKGSNTGISMDENTGVLTLPENDVTGDDNTILTISLPNEYTDKSAYLQFGFADVTKITSWTQASWQSPYVYKSEYSGLNAGTVYYVRSGYGYGHYQYYSFISDSKTNTDTGTWYERKVDYGYYGNYTVSWKMSSAPYGWDNDYFN